MLIAKLYYFWRRSLQAVHSAWLRLERYNINSKHLIHENYYYQWSEFEFAG